MHFFEGGRSLAEATKEEVNQCSEHRNDSVNSSTR
jgi:hypothetical protein